MKNALICLFSFPLICANVAAFEPVDNWAEYPRPDGAGPLNSVAFGNGLFVAGGKLGTIITSSNGADWVMQDSHSISDIARVKFVNGIFFAFAPTLLESSNGVDWVSVPGGNGVQDITFANGVYYAVIAGSGTLITSPDLVTWTNRDSPRIRWLTYANNIFAAAVDDAPKAPLNSSSDGVHWDPVLLPWVL